jgi:hypothetical protein
MAPTHCNRRTHRTLRDPRCIAIARICRRQPVEQVVDQLVPAHDDEARRRPRFAILHAAHGLL